MTVGDLTDYIMENRAGKVFVDWSREEVRLHIEHSLKNNAIVYSTNEAGNFNGVEFFHEDSA